jgi:hypothetical protein
MFSDTRSALESYAAAIGVAVIAVAAALKGEAVMEFAAFAGLAFCCCECEGLANHEVHGDYD